nr:MAG TPA: hypothetical protein [Caudoviricetes sp.]
MPRSTPSSPPDRRDKLWHSSHSKAWHGSGRTSSSVRMPSIRLNPPTAWPTLRRFPA